VHSLSLKETNKKKRKETKNNKAMKRRLYFAEKK